MCNFKLLIFFLLLCKILSVRQVIVIKGVYANCSIADKWTFFTPFASCLETGTYARSLGSIEK